MAKKKLKTVQTKTLTIDDVKRIVAESGLKITEIERGVGMPITTLDKVINDRPTPGSGAPRTLPAKWEAPMIDFIKKKKAEKMMKSIENDPILSLFKDIFGDRAFVTRISKDEFLKAKEDSEKTDNKSDILRQIEDLKNKKRNSDEEDDGN